MTDLPVNLDTTYPDDPSDPSVELHQEHHDALHALHNAIAGTAPDLASLGIAASGTYHPLGEVGHFGIVDHGATAGTARTAGLATDGSEPVLWRGTVEPTNAVNGDDWLDYS